MLDTFSAENKYCMLLESTFTMYHPKMRTKKEHRFICHEIELWFTEMKIVWRMVKRKSNDGNHNFNDTRVIQF